ncbi:Protein kinase-like domain containing protein, partial [Rhypophila decipiens]
MKTDRTNLTINRKLKDAVTPLPWKTEFGSDLRHDSSNLAVPKSEAESASVNDLGEARRLQNHDEEITQSSTTNIAQLIDRAGTQFPDAPSELENGDATRYLGSLQELENGELSKRRPTASLASRLRAELKSSLAGRDGRKFLPQDKFDEILTRAAVREELERHPELRQGGEGELTRLTDRIHKASMTERDNPDSATHRRKLFALLALMQMVPSIKDFIEAKIYDRDFPFIMEENKESDGPFYCMYSWHDLRKGDKPAARKPIQCFVKWPDHQIEGFNTNQWQLLAPYFELGSLKLYNFQENIILPFIEDTSDSLKESGFSDVWRVKIHRAHHNHRPVSDDEAENPSYAIKRLRQNKREAFDKEVEALKRFSDKDHLHLIDLLLTYHYRGKYHLVFPWADGNLSSFWTEHPSPDFPPRDWNFVKWAARQWLAIAEGLRAIHKAPKRNETRDPNDPRIHGRHGDLKPENILWFRYGHRKLKDPCEHGVFVISDFGLTSFHHNDTKDQVSPSRLARSPTYRPPECDVSKTISQSYDVWSLGCILLEFAIWYMHGWNEVDQASKRRANAERPAASASDTNYVAEDKFFELTEKVTRIVEDDATIEKEFTNLSKQGTTRFFHDLLEFVHDKLLRMRPDMRAMCDEIVAKLGEMRQKCEADEEYCTRIVPRSDRTGTNNSELLSS